MRAWIAKRRKGIIAAVAAVLVLFLDADTAQEVAAVIGTILTYAIPNAK